MTGEIRSLDDRTVREIAAGEVVERPASVVKELVENALDAGASRVAVAVENGGIDGIRVRDDGAGIPAEQLPRAVAKHATSKLDGMDDLDAGVATLGFRGEALHSVGAVAELTVRSRTPDADTGAELVVDRGENGDVEPAGCPAGTTVEVRDLFGRTPARRKFLKTPATEFDRVNAVVSAYALANPAVAVSLEHDGREVFASPGDGDRRSAVLAVYGREVAEAMVDVDFESDDAVAVSGLVSHPETTRAGREYLTTYVNDRWVRDGDLRGAVVDAYGGQLATDRYPFAVLFVDVPGEAVDVNVHPRKTEVRFDDDAGVVATVREAVRAALLDHGLVRSSAPRGRSAPEEVDADPEVVGGAGTDHERAATRRREDDRDGDAGGSDDATSSVLDAWGGSDAASPDDPPDAPAKGVTPPSDGDDAVDAPGSDADAGVDTGTDAGGGADDAGVDTGTGANGDADDDPAGTTARADDAAWSVDVDGADRPTDHPARGRTDATAGGAPSPRSWQADDDEGEGGADADGADAGAGGANSAASDADATLSRSGGGDESRSPSTDRSWDAPAQSTLGGGTTAERAERDRLPAMRVLGQYDDTYVVCGTDAGLVLIDQHAADERVNYERLRAAVDDGAPTQTLAAPVELELTAREAELFEAFRDALREVGFRAERTAGDGDGDGAEGGDGAARAGDDADASARTVAVTAVPAVFDATLDPDLLRDVLAAFADEVVDGDRPVAEVADALLADLACYPSVTGNTSLTEGSVTDLLDALDACENPYACPHGRPVLVEFGDEEIEDRFERDYPGHGGRRAE
ncbi:DNA mismatch repair protein MutL [Halobacteriales archaeon QS_6_71_20]|nr:MAG: DNA mismatch repair protein MutL [Halobacteriales archaeon QS_6_71_20]